MQLHFKRNPAEFPDTEDDEFMLMNGDQWTGISIQDASPYGGGYGVNRYGRECSTSPLTDLDFFSQDCGSFNTLAAAKEHALKVHSGEWSC
jgi:hypothetical protein